MDCAVSLPNNEPDLDDSAAVNDCNRDLMLATARSAKSFAPNCCASVLVTAVNLPAMSDSPADMLAARSAPNNLEIIALLSKPCASVLKTEPSLDAMTLELIACTSVLLMSVNLPES